METFDTINMTQILQPSQQIRWAVLEMMGPPTDPSALDLLHQTALWIETGAVARTFQETAHDHHSIPPATETPAPADAGGGASGRGGDQPHPVAADRDPAAAEGAAGESGNPAPAGGAAEAGGEVPADLGRRTPEVVAAIRALTAAGEPATAIAIVKASGIPRGSITAVLDRACQDGAVRKRKGFNLTVYEIVTPPSGNEKDVIRAIQAGSSFRTIADQHGMTVDEVRTIGALAGVCAVDAHGEIVAIGSATAVGLQTRPAVRRKCMTCQSEFISIGPHNRLCGSCRSRSDD